MNDMNDMTPLRWEIGDITRMRTALHRETNHYLQQVEQARLVAAIARAEDRPSPERIANADRAITTAQDDARHCRDLAHTLEQYASGVLFVPESRNTTAPVYSRA